MRLDVSVNMFTYQALCNNKMTVFGGKQVRPNIHIKDIVNVFFHFLNKPNLPSGPYNAGFENIKILEIAKKINEITGAKISILKSNDQRSYRQDSTKLINTSFKNKFSVLDGINEVQEWYKYITKKDIDKFYTVKWMKKLGL